METIPVRVMCGINSKSLLVRETNEMETVFVGPNELQKEVPTR